MKIIDRVLVTLSAAAALLTMSFSMPAQAAAPGTTPKPSVVKPNGGSELRAQSADDPDQAKIYFRRASNCEAKKDYACAIENYSGAIKADPSDARFRFLRGKAEMNLSRDAEAIADLNKGLVMDPKHDAAFLDLGIIYETTGQYDKAIDNYRSAAKIAPTPTNYILLARGINRIFKKLADSNQNIPATVDLNEALQALNAALKLEPDEPVNYVVYDERAIAYGNLTHAGKPVAALAEADKKKANEQQEVLLKQVKAKMAEVVAVKEKELAFERSLSPYFTARDFAAVIKLTTDAIAQNPKKFRLYIDRSEAYFGLHKYREAIADATRAIEIFPEYSDGFQVRGNSKMKSGDPAGAVADYDRAVEIDPKNYSAIAQRGSTYMFQGNYDLAEIDILRVLDLHPNDQGARSDLQTLADLRSSGYNTGKVKDDALMKFVGINSLILDYNDTVNQRFDLYDKASKEQPRDQAKVCRLLADTDVSIMVIESFADKLKDLMNGGRLDKLPTQKRLATATIGTIANYRTNINIEFTNQGCKK